MLITNKQKNIFKKKIKFFCFYLNLCSYFGFIFCSLDIHSLICALIVGISVTSVLQGINTDQLQQKLDDWGKLEILIFK